MVVVPRSAPMQRGFEIVEGVAVDLLAEGDDVFNALGEVLAGARDRLLHAVKKAGFLFFLEAAEQSLNHKKDEHPLYGRVRG